MTQTDWTERDCEYHARALKQAVHAARRCRKIGAIGALGYRLADVQWHATSFACARKALRRRKRAEAIIAIARAGRAIR